MELFLTIGFALADLQAQEEPLLHLTVVPRILNDAVQVIWEQTLIQDTVAGRPVVVNLEVGSTSVRLTITCYSAPDLSYLIVVQGFVRQGEVAGRNWRTSVQSLIVPAGERVVYFPLGRERRGAKHQMLVELHVEAVLP